MKSSAEGVARGREFAGIFDRAGRRRIFPNGGYGLRGRGWRLREGAGRWGAGGLLLNKEGAGVRGREGGACAGSARANRGAGGAVSVGGGA